MSPRRLALPRAVLRSAGPTGAAMSDFRRTILVVDDESEIRNCLEKVLLHGGFDCRTFGESVKVLSYLADPGQPADMLLAGINMPGMSGIGLLRSVKKTHPHLPVILISDSDELALAVDALEAGAVDYLTEPVRATEVVALVKRYVASNGTEQEEQVQAVLRGFLESRQRDPKSSKQLMEMIGRLGLKSLKTLQHSARVATMARVFGEYRGLSAERLRHLEVGALLHDFGKIVSRRNVLMKPAALDDEETRAMREHPVIGHRMLAHFPELREEADLVYCHHERYDGTGYPRQLRAENIPLSARIFAIVDTVDAITSDRPYRSAQSLAAARSEVQEMSGTQFDPALVKIFMTIPDEKIDEIRMTFPDARPVRGSVLGADEMLA